MFSIHFENSVWNDVQKSKSKWLFAKDLIAGTQYEILVSIHKMFKFPYLIVSSENAMHHLCTRYKNAITDDFGIFGCRI